MLRGYRQRIAIGVLAITLLSAAPLTAEARWFELDHHEKIENRSNEEGGWWERILATLETLWSESVFIIPEGGPRSSGGG